MVMNHPAEREPFDEEMLPKRARREGASGNQLQWQGQFATNGLLSSPYSQRSAGRSPSPTAVSSSSSVTTSYVSSSPSAPQLDSVSREASQIPAHLVEPLSKGNNGQVFLAYMHLDGGGTVESNERGRGRHFADQGGEGGNERQRESARPQQGENCAAEGQLEVGRSVTDGEMTERITIAVKLINTQSKHVQREIFCLKHFDNCREGHVKSLLTAEHERLENDTLNTEAPSSAVLVPSDTRLSQPPSPRLFFVKELKAHVALGLELLGPDLFDFTGKCRLFEEELCLVGIELLRTLSALHMRGLVHRSVKPENFCWNTEGLEKCRNRTSAGCLTGVEKDSDKSSPYYFPEFLFKMVDFGRGTIDASDPARTSLYERPYGGWWHSLNGFLGKPMGQKDDLMGVVHIIGYLLDDYCDSSYSESSGSSSPDASASFTSSSSAASRPESGWDHVSEGSPDVIRANGSRKDGLATTFPACSSLSNHVSKTSVKPLPDGMTENLKCTRAVSPAPCSGSVKPCRKSVRSACDGGTCSKGRQQRSYSRWRGRLRDKISQAYRIARRRYNRQMGPPPKRRARTEEGNVVDLQAQQLAEAQRNSRRSWIVQRVEEEFLPRLLPDRYFPSTLPAWWLNWYDRCNECCSDASVSAEAMTTVMMDGLRQRIDELGKTVDGVRQEVLSVYFRFSGKRGAEARKP